MTGNDAPKLIQRERVASDKFPGHDISIGIWSVSRHVDTVHIRILRWSHWQPRYSYSLDTHTMEVRRDEGEHAASLSNSHRTTA